MGKSTINHHFQVRRLLVSPAISFDDSIETSMEINRFGISQPRMEQQIRTQPWSMVL